MRFHGIMVVRDEADIVRECLEHLTRWCDAVHVLDTGSTDGTWEVVRECAKRDERVRPFASERIIFDNDVRGMVFERVRHTFAPGDWVARVDADEFYHIDPREFVATNLRPNEARIFAQQYEFALTTKELDAWERGYETLSARSRPIAERRRAYVMDPVPEQRFFKFRRGMRWGRGHPNPFNPGLPARVRIPVRHYRWRDPPQMESRCRLRAATAAISEHGVHWQQADWRSWVLPEDSPRLRWYNGQLESRNDESHLGGSAKRILQRLLYGSGLARGLDLVRRGWSEADKPRPLVGGAG